MNTHFAIPMFEALASAVRLDIVRLLVTYGTDGLIAGDIAHSLNIPPTNLSFHLKNLVQAGLVYSTQEGRYQRYTINVNAINNLIGFLTAECCSQQSPPDSTCCF